MVTISKYSEHIIVQPFLAGIIKAGPGEMSGWTWLAAGWEMSAMTRGQTKEKITIKIRLKREY